MNTRQFNELKQYIKHIWVNSLNTLNDISMSISPSTTVNIINATIDNSEIENEYIIYLTNVNIVNEIYQFASATDKL